MRPLFLRPPGAHPVAAVVVAASTCYRIAVISPPCVIMFGEICRSACR
jgi:hypothetical protein